MTPTDLREALAYLGLYQHELAHRLGISPSHFRKLLSGRHPIGGPTEVAILGMIELKKLSGITPDLAERNPLRRSGDYSYAYSGEDFCLIHGREHMRSRMGDPIPWCAACEDERKRSEERRREIDQLKEFEDAATRAIGLIDKIKHPDTGK